MTITPKIYDILIIGAGPAGAFAARKMAEAGFDVTVLEYSSQIKRKVCGEYLCPQGVALLKRHGLYDDLSKKFLPVTGMDLFSPSGKKIVSHFPMKNQVQLGLSLQRDIFDGFLVQWAQKAGAQFLFDKKVSRLTHQSDFWEIEIHQGDVFRTRLLIGADGRKSIVAKQLAQQKKHDIHRVAFHCFLQANNHQSRQGEMHLFGNGNYIGIDPIHTEQINFSLVCDAKQVLAAGSHHAIFNQHIQASKNLMDRFGLIPESVKISAVTPIHNQVKHIVGADWALIGDASGFIDPLTGEGIYNALLTAEILANELAIEKSYATNDWSSALRNYSHQRAQQLKDKANLNRGFQWLIRRPKLVELVATYLSSKSTKSDVFIGLIGNIYRPWEAFLKLIFI